MSNNNPFEFFQSILNQEAFTKSMQGMPNVDLSSFSAAMKNTTEAVSSKRVTPRVILPPIELYRDNGLAESGVVVRIAVGSWK